MATPQEAPAPEIDRALHDRLLQLYKNLDADPEIEYSRPDPRPKDEHWQADVTYYLPSGRTVHARFVLKEKGTRGQPNQVWVNTHAPGD